MTKSYTPYSLSCNTNNQDRWSVRKRKIKAYRLALGSVSTRSRVLDKFSKRDKWLFLLWWFSLTLLLNYTSLVVMQNVSYELMISSEI